MTQEYIQRFLSLRRRVIAMRFAHLNDMQLEAVLTTEGPLLLLAGAGSGKTTVLINRIVNLIAFGCGSDSSEIPPFLTESDVDFLEQYVQAPAEENRGRAELLCAMHRTAPWSIIAITFTNKAANQLKERLADQLGPAGNDVWAMTFHSACCRILRRDAERLGYERNFVIYDSSDSLHVIKQALTQLQLDEKSFPPRSVLGAISRAKDRMLTPEDMMAEASSQADFRMEQIARIYEEYQSQLLKSNAVDFDDIILLTVRLLEENPDIREYYQNKFRYVLIDEYQDTNSLQYRLASLLTGEHRNICVVGDDDQSIYKFRGATIENILNFEDHFKGARLIRMEQNYRSTVSILEAANAVIQNNVGRKGKTLWTKNDKGEKIQVYEAMNEADEADFVASRVFRAAETGSFRDCAVLYRTNAQSNALERAFQRSGIPYRIIGGHRFFDRAEVKDMLAYLYFLNNPADDFHLLRIINNPPRGIGAKTIEMATRQAAAAQKPLYDVIRNAKMYPSLEKSAAKLSSFCDLMDSCREELAEHGLPEFYDAILRATGYLTMLEDKRDTENMVRAENVKELRSSLVSYTENSETGDLSGFLEEVALFTDIEQYDPDADAAVMMTIHSAKGLEFPHVCLVGFEEGLFPGGSAAIDREEMEEERRLCYVGITRAKKTLSVSYATRRMLYGKTSFNQPSRFISELPDAYTCGKPKPRNAFADAPRMNMYGDYDVFRAPTLPKKSAPAYSSVVQTSKPTQPKLLLRQGDMVRHNTFGKGMVLTVLPMGNDALLEIAFDDHGTRKLMANTAAKYMTKA